MIPRFAALAATCQRVLWGERDRRSRGPAPRRMAVEWLEPRELLATFVVNSALDTIDANPGDGYARDAAGRCTLRAAIMEANARPGADTISLPAGTFSLSISGNKDDNCLAGDLDVKDTLTIIGAGRNKTIIDGAKIDRLFQVSAGTTMNLNSLGVTGGQPSDSGNNLSWGGAALNYGTLVAYKCNFTSNAAAQGGGVVCNQGGTFLANNCAFTTNQSTYQGGVVVNRGAGTAVTFNNCTFTGNNAGEGGLVYGGSDVQLYGCAIGETLGGYNGAFFNMTKLTLADTSIAGTSHSRSVVHAQYAGSQVSINRCTIANNSGTGVYVAGAGSTLTIANSTISGNGISDTFYYGIRLYQGASLNISNSTVANNYGTGIFNDGGAVVAVNCTIAGNSGEGVAGGATLRNTIVAGNASTDAAGSFVSQGYNLIGKGDGASGFVDGANGDQVGSIAAPLDPRLGHLKNNGGTTLTMALLEDSPAIDAGDSANVAATDQRGVARILDGNRNGTATVDIGAYEFDAGPTIQDALVVENTASNHNGVLESVDALRLVWTASDAAGIASQTIALDGVVRTMAIKNVAGTTTYYTGLGKCAVGAHAYAITATNANGTSTTLSGTFTVVAPPPPTVSGAEVIENTTSDHDGVLETTDKLRLRWNATAEAGIASQSVTIDGTKIAASIKAAVNIANRYYVGIGARTAGNHEYAITTTDTAGTSTTVVGTFTVVSPAASGLSPAARAALLNNVLDESKDDADAADWLIV